jgi:hypothetical protein
MTQVVLDDTVVGIAYPLKEFFGSGRLITRSNHNPQTHFRLPKA